MFRIFVSSSFAITLFAVYITNVVQVDSFGFGADWSWEWLWKNIEKLDRFDFSASKGGRQWNRGAQRKSRGSDLWWRKFAGDWDISSNEVDSSEENIWTSGNLYLNGKGRKHFNIETEVDSKGIGQSDGEAGNGGTGDVFNNEGNAGGGSAAEIEDGAGKNSNSSGNNIETEKPEYESESRYASNTSVKASNAGEEQEISEREGTSSNSGKGAVTTGKAETGENGVQQTSGSKQSGNTYNGSAKSGSVQSGNVYSGSAKTGSEQNGNVHGGSAKSGNEQSGNVHSGSASSGSDQSWNIRSGNVQNGNVQSGNIKSGRAQSGNAQSGSVHSGSANGNYEHEAVEVEDKATVKPAYNTLSNGINPGEREFEAEETTAKATSIPSTTTPGEKEAEFEAEGNGQTAAGQEKKSSALKTTSNHDQQYQTLPGSQSYTSARYQGQTSISPPEVQIPEDFPTSKSPHSVGSRKQTLHSLNRMHSFLPKLTIAEYVDHKITVKPKVPAAAVPPGGVNKQETVDSFTDSLSVNNLSKHSSSFTNSKSSNAGNKSPNTVTKSSGTQGHTSGSQLSHMDRMKSLILKHKNSRIIKEFLGISTDATKTMKKQVPPSGNKSLGGNANGQQTLSNGQSLSKTSTNVNDIKTAIKQFREKAVLSLSNRDLIRLMTKMATRLNETLHVPNPAVLLGIKNRAGKPNKDIVAGMSSVGIFEEQGSSIDVVPTDGSISTGAKTNFLTRTQILDQNAKLNSKKTSQNINNNDKVHGGLSQTTNTGSSTNTGSHQDLHKNVTFFDVSKAKTTDKNVNTVIDKGVQNSQSTNKGQKVTVTNNVGQKQHSNNNVSNIHSGVPDTTTQQQTTKWVNLDKSGLRSGLGTRWRGSGGWRGGSGTQGRGGSIWLTGSTNNDGWISGAKNDARELAAEMEGQWKSVNVSQIGRENATCPIYKVSYQKNAVVIETVQNKCRIIITWHPKIKQEENKEQTWWGERTYYRTKTHYVPVVTYVDIS